MLPKAGTAWRTSACELLALRLEASSQWAAAINAALGGPGASSSSSSSGGGFSLAPSPGVAHRCGAAGVAAYGRLKAYVPTAAEEAPLRERNADLAAAWDFYAKG